MTHLTRTIRSLTTLTCTLLLGVSISAQAQGLKTNSGSFGSGWQVGSGAAETGSGYGSTESVSSSAGSPASTYGGYSGGSASTGSTNGATGTYGGYSSAYGNTSASSAKETPTDSTTSSYSTPRSAGGGLRAQ